MHIDIYIEVYMYICIDIYIDINVHLHSHMHVHIYIYIYIHVHLKSLWETKGYRRHLFWTILSLTIREQQPPIGGSP